jgi:hypothetical protein
MHSGCCFYLLTATTGVFCRGGTRSLLRRTNLTRLAGRRCGHPLMILGLRRHHCRRRCAMSLSIWCARGAACRLSERHRAGAGRECQGCKSNSEPALHFTLPVNNSECALKSCRHPPNINNALPLPKFDEIKRNQPGARQKRCRSQILVRRTTATLVRSHREASAKGWVTAAQYPLTTRMGATIGVKASHLALIWQPARRANLILETAGQTQKRDRPAACRP